MIQSDSLDPVNIPIEVNAFSTEEVRGKIRQAIICCLSDCRTKYQLNLRRLEAITVSEKFDQALFEFDHGFKNKPRLSRTTGSSEGMGQTPTVLRDGKLRSHMFLPAEIVFPLVAPEAPDLYRSISVYTITHECAHAHDLDVLAGTLEREIINYEPLPTEFNFLQAIAEANWGEYAACRLSARSFPGMVAEIEKNLLTALSALPPAAVQVRSLRGSATSAKDILDLALGACHPFLNYSSYLAGHLAGLEGTLENLAPTAKNQLENAGLSVLFRRLAEVLSRMWASYGSWTDSKAYEELKGVAQETLLFTGVELFKRTNGQPAMRFALS